MAAVGIYAGSHKVALAVDTTETALVNISSEQAGFRALAAEVVLLAVQDAKCSSRASGSEKLSLCSKACVWIYSRSQRVGSFDWYCGHLGLDADVLRAQLRPQLRVNLLPISVAQLVMNDSEVAA